MSIFATLFQQCSSILSENSLQGIIYFEKLSYQLVSIISIYRILKFNNVCPVEASPRDVGTETHPGDVRIPSSSPTFVKTASNQEPKKVRRIAAQRLDLQSQTDFPSLSSTPTKETPKKRRINPTLLTSSPVEQFKPPHTRFGSPRPAPPSNPFRQAKEQVTRHNLDQERALLKEQKQKIAPAPPNGPTSNERPKIWSCIEPESSCITDKETLNRLSALYTFCLSKNLITSLFSEIRFLINLLLIRVSPDRYQPKEGYLSSVHNCTYFSAKSLQDIPDFWNFIEHSTLRLLVTNNRLTGFAPQWVAELTQLESMAIMKDTKIPNRNIGNVSFQSDTDNRFNFASEASFHVFRKQRDQFCDVWQMWKQNNSSAHWKMSAALEKTIANLVDLKKDCVNYVHLARLFRSQLLNVAQLVEVKEEEGSGPLGLLQSADPEKLRRLKERLVNPAAENRCKDGLTFEGSLVFPFKSLIYSIIFVLLFFFINLLFFFLNFIIK